MSRVQSVPLPTGGSVTLIQQPTLIANVDEPAYVPQQGPNLSAGNLVLVDPADFASTTRVAASAAVTIGGTAQANDTVELAFGGGVPATAVTYTVQPGDTLALVASGLAALITASSVLSRLISPDVSGAVLTLTYLPGGLVGNTVTVVKTIGGSGPTTTATVNHSPMTGGTGPILATRFFEAPLGVGGTMAGSAQRIFKYFREGQYYSLDAATVAAFVANGLPIA